MPVCVVVLSNSTESKELYEKLKGSSTPISTCQLIKPSSTKIRPNESKEEANRGNEDHETQELNPVNAESIPLLNPKLSKRIRQKAMAKWLMPFGFVAGLAFTKMTGLTTFSSLGLGTIGEPLIGSVLGMGSGWIGSYAAAFSVNSDNDDDVRTLLKLNQEGRWLILLETPWEVELPWQIVKGMNPIQVIRLSEQ